jgi:hypothetical protein
LCALFIRNL